MSGVCQLSWNANKQIQWEAVTVIFDELVLVRRLGPCRIGSITLVISSHLPGFTFTTAVYSLLLLGWSKQYLHVIPLVSSSLLLLLFFPSLMRLTGPFSREE